MNKYDQSFLNWFAKNGWKIHEYMGEFSVWGVEGNCPFKVTAGMVERLEKAKCIEQIFEDYGCIWDKFWMIKT